MSKLFICSLNVCGSDDDVKPETNIQNHISCSLLKSSLYVQYLLHSIKQHINVSIFAGF